MPFSVKEDYQAVVISIKGKFLGSIEGPKFKETLDELKEAGKTNLVVDLSKADFMDSSAIGALIGALTSMRKIDGDVRLAGMQKRIKNLFIMTKLLRVFDDYETVDEAVQSYA